MRRRVQNRVVRRVGALVVGAIFTAALVIHPAAASACCTIPPPPPCETHPEMCA